MWQVQDNTIFRRQYSWQFRVPIVHCSKYRPCSFYFPPEQSLAAVASFPGRRRNGLATSASSNCIRMLRHGNCNISLQQTSARDTCKFSSSENGAFLLVGATVCCPFYYWSEIEVVRVKIVMQSAYTSAIERVLLKWNGRDCDSSMHYAIEFYCCHVIRSEIWLVLPTFRQRKLQFQLAEVARPFLLRPGNEAKPAEDEPLLSHVIVYYA